MATTPERRRDPREIIPIEPPPPPPRIVPEAPPSEPDDEGDDARDSPTAPEVPAQRRPPVSRPGRREIPSRPDDPLVIDRMPDQPRVVHHGSWRSYDVVHLSAGDTGRYPAQS